MHWSQRVATNRKAKYEKAISYLQDQERTLFIFVSKPETLSLFETKRSMDELSRLGIKTRSLIINGVLPEEACTDEFFKKKREDQEKVLAAIGKEFKDIERSYFPLKDTEVIGLAPLSLSAVTSTKEWLPRKDGRCRALS